MPLSSIAFWRPPAVLSLLGIIILATVLPGTAQTQPSLVTPYVEETDMASINEAYSLDACSPWGFGHQGIDFFPTADLKPFRAVFPGTVERLEKFFNPGNGFWQVNLELRYDATYSAGYAFEPAGDEAAGNMQMANILVHNGQQVAQGQMIGYLYKGGTDPPHVHFSLFKNHDFICPEPFFTAAARDSVLRVIQKTWPQSRMCYGLPEIIPSAAITVDGHSGDWPEGLPLAGDWQADDLYGYAGSDLKALFAARDAQYLYLRLDLYENANPAFGSGASPHEGRYQVRVENEGPYPDLLLSVAGGFDRWSLGYDGSNGAGVPGELGDRPDLVGVGGKVIEIKIPLTVIGHPTRITRLSAEVNDCCLDPNAIRVLDAIHCVGGMLLPRTFFLPILIQ